MTSSMLTGDRRWASSGRRGGMTVIGKVVVPKPINLPSQRLENHGLDPNVEIVPKGTLGWGSKSPSTASNPGGSFTLSPNTDGDGGSPSCLSGRPSSGGSGTRPSTAGCDRAYEPVNNAWGLNSRPSSASGLVTSNQTTLTSPRPRSAETRPGSSHLSRFAEPVPENSGARSAAGTAEKLGVTSYKNDGFSLASGDFPTLGSEKDNSGKSIESKDHVSRERPGSSSGGVALAEESIATYIDGESSVKANVKGETAESWKRENHAYGVDAARPSGERWHADLQPYPNANIRPQHFESWQGPPVNNPPPGGIWYRGPPGAPPFRNPVPPGDFPMEPFPYFHPQMPGASHACPQPVPSPVARPRGPHPRDGDMYRPHMPDAYIRPGMPIRPGFYPGSVPYDSYYGPPMGYCNANERDVPFMGMVAAPPVHSRFPDPGNSKASSCGYGSTGKASVPEQEDPGHRNVTRGPYKVLLKQHNCLDRKDPNWEDNATNVVPCSEKDNQPTTSHNTEWGADYKDEGINPSAAVGEEASDHMADRMGGRSFHAKVTSLNNIESRCSRKAIDDTSSKKSEHVASSVESQQPFVSSPKGSILIQKIEGLNAKAWDAQPDVSSVSNRDEHRNTVHVKGNYSANELSIDGVVCTEHDNLESTNVGAVVISRRSRGMKDRSDHRGKGRINTQEGNNGWQERSPLLESPNKVLPAQAGTSNVCVLDRPSTIEASKKFGTYPQVKDTREVRGPKFGPNDFQERLKQRQKEEERISWQKANALAKLEELNRRTQAVEGSSYKRGPVQNNEGQSQVLDESMTGKFEGHKLDSHPNFVAKSKTARDEKAAFSSIEPPVEMVECATKQPVVNAISVSPQHDAHKIAFSKRKHVGVKQKQNLSLEKSAPGKVSSVRAPEALKECEDVLVNIIASPEVATNVSGSNSQPILPVNPNINVEPSMQQRRKSRGAKNKHKVEVVSSISKEANSVKISSENDKPEASEPELPSSSLDLTLASKVANCSSDLHSSLPIEESHVRVNNLSKSQHSHRVQRNPQINRAADKFHNADAVVRAPVRSNNKVEITNEGCNRTVLEAVRPAVKSNPVQDNNADDKMVVTAIDVPKPAAKELAQLGNNQQPAVASENQIKPNEAVESADSCSLSIGIKQTADSRNEDPRQNKQGKGHGSRRQRGASESTSNQELQDGLSYTSSPNRNVRKSVEHQQPKKLELSLQIGQLKLSGLGSASDILNIPNYPDPVLVKDQGVTERGKPQSFREHKNMRNSNDNDQKKMNTEDKYKSHAQSLAPQMSQTDSTSSKESHAFGERSATHWQLKSSAFSGANRRSNQLDGDQSLNVEISRGKKKASTAYSGMPIQLQHKDTGESMAQPRHDHISGKSHVEVGQKDTNKEKKLASIKGRPQLPNQGPVEPASGNTGIQYEHRSSSGLHKNGNHNSRFGRGHGDWSSSRQNIRQHNQPANHEKQRHNSQYEYQPVGSYNNTSKSSNVEGAGDSSHNMDARFRSQGQGHSRRGVGRFYGRQTESARVDAGFV